MTKEEAIKILSTRDAHGVLCGYTSGVKEALDMAIEALQFAEHFDLLKEYQSLQEVVRCKDCKHANECHKSVQHTRMEITNYPNSVTIGYSPIEWCSRGERREP